VLRGAHVIDDRRTVIETAAPSTRSAPMSLDRLIKLQEAHDGAFDGRTVAGMMLSERRARNFRSRLSQRHARRLPQSLPPTWRATRA